LRTCSKPFHKNVGEKEANNAETRKKGSTRTGKKANTFSSPNCKKKKNKSTKKCTS